MKIPLNKPRYNLRHEEMTEEDWEYYFKCREENDVEYSKEELQKLYTEAVRLFCEEGSEASAEFCIKNKFPIEPSLAKSQKDIYGFKSVQNSNLSLAKKEYPDDF